MSNTVLFALVDINICTRMLTVQEFNNVVLIFLLEYLNVTFYWRWDDRPKTTVSRKQAYVIIVIIFLEVITLPSDVLLMSSFPFDVPSCFSVFVGRHNLWKIQYYYYPYTLLYGNKCIEPFLTHFDPKSRAKCLSSNKGFLKRNLLQILAGTWQQRKRQTTVF